jgi:hypothetical protein
MTSYPSYPELSQGTTAELSQPSLIGEGSSGVHLTAQLSQEQTESPAHQTQACTATPHERLEQPNGAISVARPPKWGNPFEVGKTPGVRTNARAVELYRMWLPGQDLHHQLSAHRPRPHVLLPTRPAMPRRPCYSSWPTRSKVWTVKTVTGDTFCLSPFPAYVRAHTQVMRVAPQNVSPVTRSRRRRK